MSVLLLTSCVTKPTPSKPSEPRYERRVRVAADVPVPPWQLWDSGSLQSPEMAEAEVHLRQGQLEEAIFSYRDAIERSDSLRVREEAQLRMFGTLLKLGQSSRVLKQISAYLKAENLTIADVGERYALLVAYAYAHQNDTDQMLAWLGTAYNATGGQGLYSMQARKEMQRVIPALPPAAFREFEQRWRTDALAGPIFAKERIRRAQGGALRPKPSEKWFTASTYRTVLPPEIPNEALASRSGDVDALSDDATDVGSQAATTVPGSKRAIGVLLPLSGRFAEHALKVKEGIGLAIEADGPEKIETVYFDTKGDALIAEQEYLRLAQQEGVSVVLGPLLVKEAESVAVRSREVGLPFITFTKRSGVPGLGSAVFRLGATLEDQVDELLTYSTSQLGLRRFAVLYPEKSSGREFATIFRDTCRSMGIEIVGEYAYYQGDQDSMRSAVAEASVSAPEAVFIPDSLEGAFGVLEALENSELSDAVLLGPAQWNDPVAIRGYGQLIEGAVYVTPFYAASRSPGVSDFISSYTDKYRHAPELLAAQAYDATKLAISSLRAQKTANGKLIDTLSDVDVLNGVTGRLSVQEGGEIRRRMTVLRLYKGEVIEVMTGGVVTGFFPNDQTIQEKTKEVRPVS